MATRDHKSLTSLTPAVKAPLVGKWFHSFHADGCVEWQGHILKAVAPDLYLVQLYEWFVGAPSNQRLVRLEVMETWAFYDTNAAMNATYERTLKCRKAQP